MVFWKVYAMMHGQKNIKLWVPLLLTQFLHLIIARNMERTKLWIVNHFYYPTDELN